MSLTFEQVRDGLIRDYGLDQETAERRARAAVGELVAPPRLATRFTPPTARPEVVPVMRAIADRVIEPWERTRTESEIQTNGNDLMRALGFEVVSFSQPRASKQTPGIADSRYRHAGRKLAFWWEWKAADGEQSPDQAAFQRGEEACGCLYGIGGFGDLKMWLEAHGVASFEQDGTPIPTPYGA